MDPAWSGSAALQDKLVRWRNDAIETDSSWWGKVPARLMVSSDRILQRFDQIGGSGVKAVVGFAFFLMFLGGLVFVTLLGPKMARESTTGGGAGLTGIIWRAVAIGDEFLPEDSGVFILFEVDGSFSGNGGCNSVEGNLEQKETGIAVGPIAATEMACPGGTMGRENRFFEALRVTRGFEADAENMRLLDEGGAVLLVFVAAGG